MTLNIPQSFLDGTQDAWHAGVDKALKGASRDRLTGKTEDGLAISPLYDRRADAMPRSARRPGAPWRVMCRVDHPDLDTANALLLEELEGGADGFDLVLDSSAYARGYGVTGEDVAGFSRLLDGVLLDLVQIRIDGGYESSSVLAMLLILAEQRGIDPASLNIISCSDYISKLGHTDLLRNSVPYLARRIIDLAGFVRGKGLKGPLLCADGRLWHDRGATPVQELAFALSSGLQYLRDVDTGGFSLEDMTGYISFALAADADQVSTIAKARALRRLWASVLSQCGMPATGAHLHMETSWRMMTRPDPHVNMLRSTVACFAAGIGGADSISVLPFSSAHGLPDAFARRVARNTQTILLEECNLHKVADPAAGSGAIEARTDAMVSAAWDLFQQIEAEGGIVQSLIQGKVQARLQESRKARYERIATRRQEITGVSAFPSLSETTLRLLDGAADTVSSGMGAGELPEPGPGGDLMSAISDRLKAGASIADIVLSRRWRDMITLETPLPRPERLSEPFEVLRDRADASCAPSIFLACLGPLSQFTARATWTANAFAAGGISSTGGAEVKSLEALVEAFKASGCTVACLVSSDTIYAEQAEDAAKALKQAGADALYLAGRPKDQEAALTAAGIDRMIYAGCNLLELLSEAQIRLGVASGQEALA
ncbi:methylmalonyl-CoA mutase family protein [Roseibium suaedae]|uniref:Heterodimeric methylmalonyl-CoA mutase small subunit n=1 Tax=Roseibium suaedae TaxID=735517 RepID=A0A1M7C1G3_9HYPH|nr:methylmalonyl-CoA mutase family protein [Roseibium suaedae]SHL61075.1 heterodimeric methylmalonyl-CoA mutase small subunit [Roseibium suaedae]